MTAYFFYRSDTISEPGKPIAGIKCRFNMEMNTLEDLGKWAMEHNWPTITIDGWDLHDGTVTIIIE